MRAAAAPRETLPVFGGGTRDIEVVPWRFAQARHIEQSAAFARAIEASCAQARADERPRAPAGAAARARRRQHAGCARRDRLHVEPAEQEKQLGGDEFQNTVVQALVEAIVQFRDTRRREPR